MRNIRLSKARLAILIVQSINVFAAPFSRELSNNPYYIQELPINRPHDQERNEQRLLQDQNHENTLDPYPSKPRLTFKPDGTFKLTVFSDLHFGENPWDDWGPKQDVNSLGLMDTVLADEKPDYVYVLGLFSFFLVLRISVALA